MPVDPKALVIARKILTCDSLIVPRWEYADKVADALIAGDEEIAGLREQLRVAHERARVATSVEATALKALGDNGADPLLIVNLRDQLEEARKRADSFGAAIDAVKEELFREKQQLTAEIAGLREQLRVARAAGTALLDAMETCHICSGTLIIEDGPTYCKDCSSDCEDHEEEPCVGLDILHGNLRRALAAIDAPVKETKDAE